MFFLKQAIFNVENPCLETMLCSSQQNYVTEVEFFSRHNKAFNDLKFVYIPFWPSSDDVSAPQYNQSSSWHPAITLWSALDKNSERKSKYSCSWSIWKTDFCWGKTFGGGCCTIMHFSLYHDTEECGQAQSPTHYFP